MTVRDADGGETLSLAAMSSPRRRVTELPTWLEAWTIYAAARVSYDPEQAAELLAYQGLILAAARQYSFSAVLDYDVSFRQLAATNRNLRWDRRDIDLFTRCFTDRGLRHDSTVARTPFRDGGGAPGCGAFPVFSTQRHTRTADGAYICRNFNTKGCTSKTCAYAHCCFSCRGPHSASTARCGLPSP